MTQPPHAGPSPRSLKIVAAVTVALTAIPMCGGVYALRRALLPPAEIDVATLMDRDRTQVGDFVTVTLRPRLDDLDVIESYAQYQGFLLGVEEDPNLIVFAEPHSELGEAVLATRPFEADGLSVDAFAEATRPRRVTGLVHDLDDYAIVLSNLPGHVIDDHAHAVYGERPPDAVRVLEVGPSRASFLFIGAGSVCTCALPLFALALYGLFRARRVERRPTAF
jgi:hypothetical protein